MITIWQAALLGLVQGISEFLPISSSGHLVLVQRALNLSSEVMSSGEMVFFDTMLHVGTLAAVFWVFRKDIWGLIRKPVSKLMGMLIIGTIPAVLVTLLLGDYVNEMFEGALLGWGFLATCGLLMFVEGNEERKNTKEAKDMHWHDALWIGLAQGIALMPGVSRSGATISGGLIRGLTRSFAAKFSLLLSIPAILGGVVVNGRDLITGGTFAIPWTATIIGMLCAAVSGFFAIKVLLKVLSKGSLKGFAIYVGAMGLLVLLDQYVLHIIF